jgi:hypothetical protein
MKWAPTVKIHPNQEESCIHAKKHVEEIKADYGDQQLVNLIDKKGSQLRVGNSFTNVINNLQDKNIHYVWFDFHHECKGMKYENMAKLVE